MYLTRSTHSNLSRSRQQIWTDPLLPRRRAPDPTTARRLTDLWVRTKIANEAVQKRQASVNNQLLGLLGPYLWHVIGTFNTCSRVPTPRSLIDTGEGYNLGGVSFPRITSWPSQPMVLHFSPKGIAWSQVIQSQHKPQVKVMWNTYRRSVVFQPLNIYQNLYLRLAMANIIQILARSSRVIRKVFIM
jgi:hypothetical protein